ACSLQVPSVLPTERIAHLSCGRRLLHCGISISATTAQGSTSVIRRCLINIRITPQPDLSASSWHVRNVPGAEHVTGTLKVDRGSNLVRDRKRRSESMRLPSGAGALLHAA